MIREPNSPIYRGMDLGVVQIDLGLLQCGLRYQHLGLRRARIGRPLIERRLRNVLTTDKFLAALELHRSVGVRRPSLGQIRFLLLDGSLVCRLLDPEQQIACLDQLAFREKASFDENRYPRDDIHLIDCDDSADETRRVHDLATDHRNHRRAPARPAHRSSRC